MPHIQVVFPPSGEPIVCDDPKAIIQDKHIFWHVYNANPKVQFVRIEVSPDPVGGGFPAPEDPKYFPKVDQNGAPICETWIEKKLDGRKCTIWGKAPRHSRPQDRAKYTIAGLAASGGAPIISLDPTLISDQP
jgi:hypothetical protein